MKNLIFLFVGLLLMTTATSCKKDKVEDKVEDTCTPPELKKNIVGTWESRDASGSQSMIEFKDDGTYDDPDDAIVGGASQGVAYTYKTYEILSETEIKFKAAAPAGSGSSGYVASTFDVKDNQCDVIKLNLSGLGSLGDLTLTRK